ncbi:all-trans-retinol 13,14-reductase [Aureococcus anophagefferens]|nr:all-trans-retinol 13,14-reductase [Aureococcus anophagefferens]
MDAVGAEVDWVTYDGWGVHDLRAGEAFRIGVHAGPAHGARGGLADLADVDDAFVLKWLDYLAFALSGRPADDTVGAAVAYTLGDLHRPGAFLDYPVGGSGAVAEALAASIAKAGSAVSSPRRVNADIWNTVKLLPARVAPAWRAATERDVAPTPSFVHLWVGFDGADIPADLDVHHTVFNEGFLGDDAAAIDARENMYIISIPSLFDAALAPEGKHVAHCYAAAHEPFEAWEHLDRTSQEYKAKKEAAAEPLWRAEPFAAFASFFAMAAWASATFSEVCTASFQDASSHSASK